MVAKNIAKIAIFFTFMNNIENYFVSSKILLNKNEIRIVFVFLCCWVSEWVIVFEQLQDQFSHRDSDWPRFLYDSLSLCEHIVTTDDV